MSEREVRRAAVLAQVAAKEWTLGEAAERMELSYRQTKRLWKQYRKPRGGGTGARERGAEIEPGQAAEVAGQGAGADPGAVLRRTRREIRADAGRGASGQRKGNRDWGGHPAAGMLAAGLWSRERKVRAHRSRRARREHFGELLQMDSSFHQWLEERGPRGCLMNLVDDATGTTLCRLGEQETIWAAVGVLTAWIEKYGVPRALYTDWKNVYVREPTSQELLQGKPAVTQFGRMCERLGIQIIAARSPQAKGRGAESWHAPGPAGEEAAAEEDQHPRRGEPVSGRRVLRRAQPALCGGGALRSGLSFAGARRQEAARDFPAGDGAGAGQRLGGALPQPVLSGRAAEPESRTGQKEGSCL